MNGYTLKELDELKSKVYGMLEKKLLEYNASWIETSDKVDHSSNTLIPSGFNHGS